MNDKKISWGWKLATNPTDAVKFMNGNGIYQLPVTDVKISAVNKTNQHEFYIFYQRDSSSSPLDGWRWKLVTNTEDVLNFLNGQEPYKNVVADARICGFSKGRRTLFYIFYRFGKYKVCFSWSLKQATTRKEARHFLNGDEAYSIPAERAEIATVSAGKKIQYYIFYTKGSPGRPSGTWDSEIATSPDAVVAKLNRQGDYPSPVRDAKIVTSYQSGDVTKFLVFYPPVFLIITRPLFVSSLQGYINWKYARGFEVCLLTAEWIDVHVPGDNIRLKIRNCIRHYVNTIGLKYALLIGDSVDITTDPVIEPPPPLLSEPWNLPAGYYHIINGYFYSTLYYSDQTDRVDYLESTVLTFSGEYPVAVGVMPVRTTEELTNLLFKTMNVTRTQQASFVFSEDGCSETAVHTFSEIPALAGSGISISTSIFSTSTPASQIYTMLFERPGVILELGHGGLGQFRIGNTYIYNTDAQKFQYINPLFIELSCYIFAYFLGECLDEAFLKSQKGPAVITSLYPVGGHGLPGRWISSLEAGFWQDLFAGKSIGQAFYDHCKGALLNPLHLFGDPSLVIFGTK